MPFRKVASKQLSEVLKALAHPHRLQIVEDIGAGELDVNSLQATLGISHSAVSQHLALLRAHRIVAERRDGRFVFYRLRRPEMAAWLLEGLSFISEESAEAEQVRLAVDKARAVWSGRPAEGDGKKKQPTANKRRGVTAGGGG